MAKRELNAGLRRRRRKQAFWIFAAIYGVVMLWVALEIISFRNANTQSDAGFFAALLPAFKDLRTNAFHFKLIGPHTLDTMMWVGLVYLLSVALLYLDDQRHAHDLSGVECGSAQWNNDSKEYNAEFTDKNPFENTLLSKNVVLAMNTRKTQRNNNVLIIGGSGSGKSRGFVKPNILQSNCNMVITDPSGELIESTGKFLVDNDYHLKVFNLVQMEKSNCYNPFHYIRNEAGVMMMINCLITNTTPPDQHAGDPFWEKSETLLLMALCFYLWQHRPLEEQNFSTVLELLRMAEVDERNDKYRSHLDRIFLAPEGKKTSSSSAGAIPGSSGSVMDVQKAMEENSEPDMLDDSDKEFREKWLGGAHYKNKNGDVIANTGFLSLEEMDPDGTDIAVNQYKAFKKGAGKTAKSILISCMVRLQAFNIPQVSHLTKVDDIHLENISGIDKTEPKQALFVIIPAADNTYNFLVSMMYAQLFETLYFVGDSQCEKQRMPRHVKFLLDEFANIGQIPQFTEKLATMRKYEISCSVILQNIAQIKKNYKDDWETIIGNCDSIVFLGGKEPTTEKYISEMLGKQTITVVNRSSSDDKKHSGGSGSYSQKDRSLLEPDELGTIPNNTCVVMIRGVDPFLDEKIDYTSHPNYSQTGDAEPKLNYKITLDNSNLNMDKIAIDAQQIATYKNNRINAVTSIASLSADNPQWADYPNIYAKFKIVLSDTEPVIIEEDPSGGETVAVVSDESNEVWLNQSQDDVELYQRPSDDEVPSQNLYGLLGSDGKPRETPVPEDCGYSASLADILANEGIFENDCD